MVTGKAPTTPDRLVEGVLQSVEDAAAQLDVSADYMLRQTTVFRFSGTTAINALLMPRVLEYLEDTTHEGERVYRCLKCGHVLGPVADDYKEHSGTFDGEISEGEPDELAPPDSDFVLRHYICPSCGILFEVDMVRRSDERLRSVRLA